jgi:hypothetical protein
MTAAIFDRLPLRAPPPTATIEKSDWIPPQVTYSIRFSFVRFSCGYDTALYSSVKRHSAPLVILLHIC